MGIAVVLIVAIILLVVAFFAFNTYSALGGMVNTNLHIYFKARKQGATHEEALGWMIQTRYMNDPAKQARVLDWVKSASLHCNECDDIRAAIEHMFGIEHGFETALQATPKLDALIEKEYAKRANSAY